MSKTTEPSLVDAGMFTRRAEVEEFAAEHGVTFAEAVVHLVNRSLSLPDPEPTFDDKLHDVQRRIQEATDRAGWLDTAAADAPLELAGAIVDLGRAVSHLVRVQRRELRRAVEL